MFASKSKHAIYLGLEPQWGFAACLSKNMNGDYPYNDVWKPKGDNRMEIPFIAECFAKGKKAIVGE